MVQVGPVHDPDSDWFRQRRAGYSTAMRQAGLSLPPMISLDMPRFDPDHPLEDAPTKLRSMAFTPTGRLLDVLGERARTVEAIMAVCDTDAFLLGEALRLIGREPGRDVWVTGYDNYWNKLPPGEAVIREI